MDKNKGVEMTQERIEELNLLTIPPPSEIPESEMNSKEKEKRKTFVFQFQCQTLRHGIRQLFPMTQVNYCRRQNGMLTWSFVVFDQENNYRILFMDTTKIELGTMANFIEQNLTQVRA